MISPSNQVGGALPGLTLKAWAQITAAGVLIRGFNVASTSKTGTGEYLITFTVAMGAITYVVRVHGIRKSGGTSTTGVVAALSTKAVGSFRVVVSDDGVVADTDTFVEVYE